ncbi:hypothetical protein VF709_21290 [Enterobacter sp. Lyrl_3]
MLHRYLSPVLLVAMVLAGCQTRPQGKFTAEQIAAMTSYGFSEHDGDWSLGISDEILFGKNDYHLRDDTVQKIDAMADVWAEGAKVPRSNLTSRGLGKKYPIASNQTSEGRAENRRVAIVITAP